MGALRRFSGDGLRQVRPASRCQAAGSTHSGPPYFASLTRVLTGTAAIRSAGDVTGSVSSAPGRDSSGSRQGPNAARGRDGGHPVVDGPDQVVRLGGDDGASRQCVGRLEGPPPGIVAVPVA